jgi:type I restriction enzyme S subunit
VKAGEAEIKTGPFGTQLKASDYQESGTPVINVRNIGFGNIREDKLEYIGDHTVRRLASHLLRAEDIVFGRKGAVERHVFIRQGQSNWFQGSDCLRLRLSSKRVLPRFASYFFLTHEHQRWMMGQCSHGATMASLNQDIISRISLPNPPIDTQRRIAAILSAYDDLIENNTRRIAILEEMVRRIYEEWFVRYRFPGHENVRMVESELGLVPEGWAVQTVEQTFQILGGGTPSKAEPAYWDGGTINWYSPTDLTKAGTSFTEGSSDRITPLGLAKSSAKLFPPFSVMLTSRATIGVVAVNTSEACTNQGFITCLPNEAFPLWVLFHWVKANVETFISLGTGATFKEITKGTFKGIKLVATTQEVADQFMTAVSPLMNLSRNLQSKNANLRTTRDLLLPKLISGELDVSHLPEPEAMAA